MMDREDKKQLDWLLGSVDGRSDAKMPDITSPEYRQGYLYGQSLPGHAEDDLELLNLMCGAPVKSPDIDYTKPRQYKTGSAFARDCFAAESMGYSDGKIGRPRPVKMSMSYERGYLRGLLDKVPEVGTSTAAPVDN